MNLSRQSVCVACIATIFLVPGLLQAQASVNHGPIAQVVMNPTQILFKPQIQGADATLTVSGPGDFYYQRTFDQQGSPAFVILDRAGNTLVDGGYNYELGVKWNLANDVQQAMCRARETGDYSEVHSLRQRGRIPEAVKPQSGYFTIAGGKIVVDDGSEAKSDGSTETTAGTAKSPALFKDILHYDDVIITGSLCVGFDCANGESFGFDTIILKEHNLRVYFNDTSYTASYPTNAWRLTANDSTNGGASYFSIDDVDDGRSIFKVEAGAPSNSLYVEDYGRVGLGTSTPVTELHIKDSDTPTVRLEQDSSGGWTAQTFDVAANESNFFIRDATNGSKLPFRIQPGTPSSTLSLKSDGKVGVGTWSPDATLEVSGDSTSVGTGNAALKLTNLNGAVALQLDANDNGTFWNFSVLSDDDHFRISKSGTGTTELELDGSGDLTITGGLVTGTAGSCTSVSPCDGVYDPSFDLETIEDHSAYMWANSHLPAIGPTPPAAPFNITRKTAGLINELEKAHIYIEQLNERLKTTESENHQLRERLEAIEDLLTSSLERSGGQR